MTRKERRPDRLRLLRLFRRHNGGATAIEFGIVIAPFLALMFAIMETALVFFASQTLETAVADSARLILTGQAQVSSMTQDKFKESVCSRIHGLFDCQGGIRIDVRSYSTFSGAVIAPPIDADKKLIEDFQYDIGGPGSIVVVRAMYEWPIITSFMGFSLSDLANGKRLIMATAAFRNEVFQ